MDASWLILGSVVAAASAIAVAGYRLVERRAARRVLAGMAAAPREDREGIWRRPGWLPRWLGRAGFREPGAPSVFVSVVALAALLGLALLLIVAWLDAFAPLARGLRGVPGGIGEAFVPILAAGPFVNALGLAAVPWLVVRRRRRRLVEAVEQDLPLALDLLATLAEAGLGFDAALARVLGSAPSERPLARDLRLFQLELRSGRPRLQCYYRLRERLDVASMNVLVSALVTAEQLGASVAEVLRMQAEDIRGRRRERALALAQTVPVKLVFPLMICFLPSIFVITLGPAFYQLFRLADTVTRGAR